MTDVAGLVRDHVLYRIFDDSDRLLYVGITMNVEDRFADHRGSKGWWASATTIRLQHYDSREAVEQAEVEAIRDEAPRFNVRHGTHLPARAGRVTRSPLRKHHRNFRIDDATWGDAQTVARLRGERFSDALRRELDAYVAEHRHLLDTNS